LGEIQPELKRPGKENPFSCLLAWPKVQRILDHETDKRLLESFAHLVSSRQLPAGDRKAQTLALKKFKESVTEEYTPQAGFLNDLSRCALRVGEKCVSFTFGKGKCVTSPHVSLNSAGSYFATVLEGGRGKEIREALISRLTVIPKEDESIQTPFGLLSCPAGRPRWRFWCRASEYTFYEDIPFGEPITEEIFAEQNLYFQGFDEVIGCQILVTAYLDYQEWKLTGLGIPCRVLVVPEPGFKARIVTTGPYWLNILQQGLSHQLKDILKNHPSSKSSLQKTDQAWQSLYLMNPQGYPKDYLCLSSDLKEATDHIPRVVAKRLLEGFIKGTALRSNLIETCIDLIEMDRCFISNDYVIESHTRGSMMGEPLTKCVLTILNLVVEELAFRKYYKINLNRSFLKEKPLRFYHIGGDDHLAIGPKQYLDYITENHLKCGSHISEGKHGISNKVVIYCEKVLDIKNIYRPFNLKSINDSTEGYEASPFVDSIKVRLLSPTTKSFEVVADRNVAIGKGLSLGRTLKWLNRDHYPTKWVRMVRDRFFSRMGSLLPDRTSGVYWQLLLPSYWGGLDLYLPDEVEELYVRLPELTLSIMDAYLQNEQSAFVEIELLRKFLTNYSFRGYRLNETEVEAMRSHVENVIKAHLPSKGWRELKQEFDPLDQHSATDLADTIYKEGWRMEEDIIDELLRPLLFKEILLGIDRLQPYNTEKLKVRYAKLWDLTYRGPHSSQKFTPKELEGLLLTRPKGMFYKVGYPEEIHFVSDRGYIYKSALDDALHSMPVLRIGRPYA